MDATSHRGRKLASTASAPAHHNGVAAHHGGLSLMVVMLAVEGLPTTPLTFPNIMGFTYLSVVGTAFAYVLWFRGITRLPASTTAFLGLLSPVVAILLGWMITGEDLTFVQMVGIVIV
ncbi:MAG: EamA family transporter, partial [Kineosporiaceae bacterium]|nr:EamA family transporter [Aeromicrobium sp.]